MPEITVEIEIKCSCGEGLCNQSTGELTRRGPVFVVEPCQKCLEASENEKYTKLEEQYDKLQAYCDDLEKDFLKKRTTEIEVADERTI